MGEERKEISIESCKSLEGPNVHALFPVIEAELDLGDHVDHASDEQIAENLVELYPEIKTHRCSGSEEGYFVKRLNRGTYPAHIIEHLALAMQNMAGSSVSFGKARRAEGSKYNVVFEYKIKEAAVKALDLAVETMNGLFDETLETAKIKEEIESVKDLVYRKRLGPSTKEIIHQTKKKDIPYDDVDSDYSFFKLGWGVNQKKIWGPVTSETDLIGADVAKNKLLAKKTLYEGGFPVPRGEVAGSEDEAVEIAGDLRYPVALKPVRGHHGKGVIGDLRSEEELRVAYSISDKYSDRVLVEQFVEGDDYRFLVVNHEVVAVAKRVPPHVVGDGKSTIEELVDEINQDPKRGEGHRCVLTKIEIGKEEERFLNRRGYTPQSVPEKDEKVFLRIGGN
ncbi:MAG: cyanophycin synthetase, partial [Candidatus Thermoplasmatota archaeon]|nr:cyanophycin synthetase [Candidatus Thermoplasmatota archaeon]